MEPRTILHSELVEPNLHVPKAHQHDDRYYTEAEVNALIASATIADATTTTKGKVQLAGELAGTAALPTLKNVQRVISVKDYGAKGDARQIVGGTISAGSTSLTLSGGSFASTDVGKLIFIDRAGPLNSSVPYTLRTTIAAVVSATQVTLTAAATTTVTAALVS